jgi:hypothetical protein
MLLSSWLASTNYLKVRVKNLIINYPDTRKSQVQWDWQILKILEEMNASCSGYIGWLAHGSYHISNSHKYLYNACCY